MTRKIKDGFLSETKCAFGDNARFTADASNSIRQKLFSFLGDSPKFKDLIIQTGNANKGKDFFPKPLDSLNVQQSCIKNRVRALIVIESFFANSEIKTEMQSRFDPNLSTSNKMNLADTNANDTTSYYCIANLSFLYSVGIRMYGRDGSILDEYRKNKIFTILITRTTKDEAINNLPNRDALINSLANDMADIYTQRISPLWGSEFRTVWVNSNRFSIEAKDLALVNNWKGAQLIWNHIYFNAKPFKKAMAAFNLAVSSEVLGNLNESFDYLNEAINYFSTYPNEYYIQKCTEYLAVLKKRKGEAPKLNEQMDH